MAIADGQGRQLGGALAARLAAEAALSFLEGMFHAIEVYTLRIVISVADEVVEGEGEARFTTLIVVCADENQIIGASVGDSQTWHITKSHSVELSERQRKNLSLGSGAALGTSFHVTVQTALVDIGFIPSPAHAV